MNMHMACKLFLSLSFFSVFVCSVAGGNVTLDEDGIKELCTKIVREENRHLTGKMNNQYVCTLFMFVYVCGILLLTRTFFFVGVISE